MTTSTLNPTFPEAIALSTATIALTDDQIEAAMELARPITDPDRQWQVYLNALALTGFEAWLTMRSPDLSFNSQDCPLFKANPADRLPIAANLRVGQLRVSTVAISLNSILSIPSAVLEQSQAQSDYYVALDTIEEEGLVTIAGFISDRQLRADLATSQPDAHGNYDLPFRSLNLDLNEFLLYARCLQPTLAPVSLAAELPQTSTVETIAQRVINMGDWFQGALDDVARELSWVLLPNLASAAVEFRSVTTDRSNPASEVEAIRAELQQKQQLNIPSTAKAACYGFQLCGYSLRKYVLVWEIISSDTPIEYNFLVAITPVDGEFLPQGLELKVTDKSQLLATSQANIDANLFAHLSGDVEDIFAVTVSLGNHTLTSRLSCQFP
jgi:hypothetical protein